MAKPEHHRTHRIGWLRAAVLGANDGIVSTASLIVGIAAANASKSTVLLAALAGLVAGAMSMAAGEYVSVSSQADTEEADLDLEREALEKNPEYELAELTKIYVERGLAAELALQVARQLMQHDALGAPARDELGFSETHSARPIQAALASGAAFSAGAVLPTLLILAFPQGYVAWGVAGACIPLLSLLGWLSARAGGAAPLRPMLRITFWGAGAMALTAAVGRLFGV
ncbi:MAG: VIT family protein [Myxococcales bacterium]|nr:VIT family protein [Myxococcales bacterium]